MSDPSDQHVGFDGLIEAAAAAEGFNWKDEADDTDVSQAAVSVLRFRVGDREFAVPTEYVHEIVSDLEVTPVPGAPKHVRGVSVLRRQVIGILNLYQWLDPVAEGDEIDPDRVVIVEAGPYRVGVETTEVSGLEEWPRQVLDRSRIPASINARTRRYAAGMRLSDDEAVVLLDVPRLLDDAAVQ